MSVLTAAFLTTAGVVINDTAVEVGLSAVDDPYGSVDQNFVQLCKLLIVTGRDVMREWDWSYLKFEGSIALVSGTSTYALPTGFRAMVPNSQWDRTSRRSAAAGATSQQWQYLSGINATVTLQVVLRPLQGTLEVYGGSSIPDAHVVYFEYQSNYWVKQAQTFPEVAIPNSDRPAATGDTLLLDPHLLTRGLKLRFLQAKGFDTTAAEDDYRRALSAAKSQDGMAPTLHLGRPVLGEPMISIANVADTGYGT